MNLVLFAPQLVEAFSRLVLGHRADLLNGEPVPEKSFNKVQRQ